MKRKKRRSGGGGSNMRGDSDRLSSLPEPIILHIFSFLETIHALRMSAVSRQWRHFWLSIPSVSFDDWVAFFVRRRPPEGCEKFEDFVNWVLMSQNRAANQLESFRLRQSSLSGKYTFYRWMDVITGKNLQELDVHIYNYFGKKELPHCIFNCGSLVSLKLNMRNSVLNQKTFPGFKRLKTLELRSLKLQSSGLIENLVSSCPMLENLTVDNCSLCWLKSLDITATSLKNLSIDFIQTMSINLKIACPNLVSLTLTYLASLYLQFEEMNALENLFMELRRPGAHESVTGARCCHVMSQILKAICNVKVLRVSHPFLTYLHQAVDHSEFFSASFNNLKSLTLDLGAFDLYRQSLINLLNWSPNLEAVTIDFRNIDQEQHPEDCDNRWKSSIKTISCLKYHLKKVELIGVRGNKHELDMVKFLLKNGHVLEKMSIRFIGKLQNVDEIIAKVMKFCKSSPNVALAFEKPKFDRPWRIPTRFGFFKYY